jgi:hypothetical protein
MDNKKGINAAAAENSLQQEKKKQEEMRDLNKNAQNEAEKDLKNDPEFSAHHPNDDLDEGETARLGEDKTGLV